MALTYTTACDRDDARSVADTRRIDTGDVLLAATSLVAVLAIALAYAGRRAVAESPESGRAPSVSVVNLNEIAAASQLEAALGLAFSNSVDRGLASEHMLQFVAASRRDEPLRGVGAALAAVVPAAAIDAAPQSVVYAERLRLARERAAAAGHQGPNAVPLLTVADLSAVRPAMAVRTYDEFRSAVEINAAAYVGAFLAIALVWRLRRVRGDRWLLGVAHLLTAIGFATLVSRADPLRDPLLFVRFTQAVVIGCVLMGAASMMTRGRAPLRDLSYIPLVLALALSVLVILFGDGPGQSSAKVNLGPVQPIEAIRLLLALFLAGYFARQWELLRGLRHPAPSWLDMPRMQHVLPLVGGVGAAATLFFVQRDLGPALLLACGFLAMYAVARARVLLALAGFAGLVASFFLGYLLNISTTLNERVQMWLSPWDNGVRGGDQVAQAIWSLATGGSLGVGLGLGDTRYLPAGHTDLVLAAIGEELGAIGIVVIAGLYALIAWRGLRIARRATSDYDVYLATSLTLFLVIPALVMGAGVLGLMPLTGVVTPFLSYGGSAMTANLGALGMLAVIRNDAESPASAEPFVVPLRWLARGLAGCAACLAAAFLNVQVLRGDEFATRAHLSLQGDGVKRYQYNPRLLDVIRRIPRGTVYDRRGLPLASADAAALQRARKDYASIGLSIESACASQAERCYPLGGRAFHLLGDARSRVNWAASNTAFVERDAEDRLRGFDDHALAVQASSGPVLIRRDYRELLPLLRHRHDLDHADARAFLDRSRDLRLTIDARLQARVADVLAAAAWRSASRHAAAVVIDPATGDVLAAASYPWRIESTKADTRGADAEDDSLLDRARYGLYPPGSTFKLLTAAAALRQGPSADHAVFFCTRLPDGRVGARIPGRGRPIRDDVLDKVPHGRIGLHDAMVHSCNAYFAQLAERVGADALVDVASPFGIALTPANSRSRLRDTLPQAGYGQGDVLTTPLRMARVAGAFAADGVLHESGVYAGTRRAPETWLPREDARVVAAYLRDAVLEGTGRSLRNHPWRIAGKTGTAELAGAPSHAWFAGFAPYGRTTARIAVAVIIENAGYGGLAAAPVAGEIVSAAADLGLIR